MNRLSRATRDRLAPELLSPRRAGEPGIGVVHFGPGAFHRAHQAAYLDQLLADDPRWGIAAVSLRSRGTVEALAAQDGLYTLAIRDAASANHVIDAHRAFLGPEDAAETRALLARPNVGLVTTTVTEKGYCLSPDGSLDLSHPDIVHDLAGTAVPRSVIGWIVAGLADRRAGGTAPFVPLPCDNLSGNGRKLHDALVAYARVTDPGLADWIAGEVRVPATMVDSITPASDEALYADVAGAIDLADRAAVQREAFAQWVVEDLGVPLGPDLASVGVTVTVDVAGYEKAKLRILNGSHSTLAYAGLLRGHGSVAEAMADDALARFVEAMIREEIAPMLPRVAGLDLGAYASAVLARFRNPVIIHRLEQIAQDGSQKVPYRLGDTLIAYRERGQLPRRTVAAIGAWIAFLVQRSRAGTPIADPAGAELARLASGGPAEAVRGLQAHGLGLPPVLAGDAELGTALVSATEAMLAGGERVLGPA